MITTVIIEDKYGMLHKGEVETEYEPQVDQFVTVKTFNEKYKSGYIIELDERRMF